MYKLENWSVRTRDENPYLPPEVKSIVLCGEVYNHPIFMSGEYVTTSSVKKAEGRLITTSKGSVYELGKVDPLYVKWLKEIGREFDEENPIKVIE